MHEYTRPSSAPGRGSLFRLACKRDLEGIVAKGKFDPYLLDSPKWYKIRNRSYSQWVGREELFDGERASESQLALLERVCSGKWELVEVPPQ